MGLAVGCDARILAAGFALVLLDDRLLLFHRLLQEPPAACCTSSPCSPGGLRVFGDIIT
jgi:hypothetical protein